VAALEGTEPVARPFLFGTNLKMNQTADETARFVAELARAVAPPTPGAHLFVLPPYTSLPAATVAAREHRSALWIGAQNMHWAAEGAYTGEVSARMLTALGVDLVLLGHAERRGLFQETDEAINQKILAAQAAGLRVLLCVGETAAEKERGAGEETVARQLTTALDELDLAALPRMQVAYEPVWSIGAGGTPARPEDIAPVAARLRATLGGLFGDPGRGVSILYGGSVDQTNAGAFTALPDIDGLFVGRAAWSVDGFRATLAAALAGRPPS